MAALKEKFLNKIEYHNNKHGRIIIEHMEVEIDGAGRENTQKTRNHQKETPFHNVAFRKTGIGYR